MKTRKFLKSPRYAAWCLTAAFATAAAACSTSGEAQSQVGKPEPLEAPGIPVTTATVERKSMPLAIDVVGTAEAYSTVAVRAQITGALTSVGFTEGDDVTKGQPLFTLDRRPLEAALQQAQATLARDTAQATNAKSSAARYQDLQTRGIATREQADQSRTAAAALEATLEADRAALENATVQLEYATIAAPLTGRTGALMVHEGNLVRANDTTPLVVINQVSPIYVSFGVPEDRLSDVRQYLSRGTIRVEAAPSGGTAASSGRITFIDNAVDSTTGQIRMKAEFPNADRQLWPGQFTNLTVILSTVADAVVVPTAAVQNGQQGTYVFVVKPDMTVDLRPITVERQVGNQMIVKNGVSLNDIVVTDGQLRLVKGARVSIKTGSVETTSKAQP